MVKKKRVVFVGSFIEKAKDGSVGGQMYACRSLVASELSNEIDWIFLDTTGDSVPPPPIYIRLVAAVIRIFKFGLICIFKRPDSALIFSANGPSIYEKGVMAIWASFLKINVIIAPRGGPLNKEIEQNELLKWFVRFVFKKANFIVCQGTYWKTFFASLLPNSDENKFVIISNWIDLELYSFNDEQAKNKYNGLTILFMGWMHTDKGVYDIFDAIAQLPIFKEKVKFVFLGDGLAKNDLMRISKSWSHLFEFEFPGWVYGKEKINYIYNSDIFLLPSYSEGLPNSLMEAMACGIPSIATKIGSIPDLIISNKTGLLIDAGNTKNLSKALSLLILDSKLRKELGNNGKERIKKNHSINTAIEIFKKIL